MSIHVFYQPIDISLVQEELFPYICGKGDLRKLKSMCDDPVGALTNVELLRTAYAASLAGEEFRDPEFGRCDPQSYLAESAVRDTLEFCRHVWPEWMVSASTSIELLPDSFPVLEHYQMPISMFEPLAEFIPDIRWDLETIAECEFMGGVLRAAHVPVVRTAIAAELANMTRCAGDPHYYDATRTLLEALTYAEENRLSFTEAIT